MGFNQASRSIITTFIGNVTRIPTLDGPFLPKGTRIFATESSRERFCDRVLESLDVSPQGLASKQEKEPKPM